MANKLIGSVGLSPGSDEGTDLTTKGDLHGYSTTNTRIPIGSNNQVLTADSAQALGLKWADSAGGGATEFIGKATASGSTSFIEVTFTAIPEGDIAYIYGVFSGDSIAAQGSELIVNGVTNSYDQQGITVTGGAASYPNISSETHFDLDNSNLGQNETAYFQVKINPYDEKLNLMAFTVGVNPGIAYNGGQNTNTWSEYNAIRVRTASGGNIPANSILEVYKMKNT